MAENQNRIVVDAVEFGELFQFPKILRAATGAMQPGRLVIALLSVLVLIVTGRIWDGATAPTVHPIGLIASMGMPERERERADVYIQELLGDALQRYVDANDWPAQSSEGRWAEPLDARDIVPMVRRSYAALRRDRGDDVAASDERFQAFMLRIEETRTLGTFEAVQRDLSTAFHAILSAAVTVQPPAILAGLGAIVVQLPVAVWQHDPWFAAVYGLVLLVVLAVGGGALSRMAACQLASEERLSIREATDFALSHCIRLVLSLLLPLVVLALIAALIALLGLLLGPWIDVIGGPLYGLLLLIGFVLAFLLLGYLIGLPMLVPAVACENCDAPDAWQRACAYIIGRPLHLVGYALTGIFGLVLGSLVVAGVAWLTLALTGALAEVLIDNSALLEAGVAGSTGADFGATVPMHDTWHERWAAWFIDMWRTIAQDIVAAYVFACLFSTSTIIYLLMRRACDGQAIDEIWRPGLVPGTFVPDNAEADPASVETGSDDERGDGSGG